VTAFRRGIPTLGNAGMLMPGGKLFKLDELALKKGFKICAVQLSVFRSVLDQHECCELTRT
jgi:hypothetical protein